MGLATIARSAGGVARIAWPAAGLPEGVGKAAFEARCLNCHDAAQAINTRRTRADWERVIEDMVARGANGTDEELDAIAAYLTKFFGKGSN